MEPHFGTFEPVFSSAHGYLALLRLDGEDAIEAVELVRRCCKAVPDPFPSICHLLSDPNWRPNLVAAVAAILCGHNAEMLRCLWRRLDAGSWVTPQLGVALFLVDSDFEAQSRMRLEAECPVDMADLVSMTGPERHSVAGPAGRLERSAKAAAVLLHLVQMVTPLPHWVGRVASSGSVRALLAEDVDGASGIAQGWLRRVQMITPCRG